ncbi:MAG: DUF5946 family protein [Ardenticatenaceae bacterium]|nr:DUF5946 family protein [Ardenticatenaceae bacterium]HBY98536.1 hypothetical protein [Chloroflexota bacterium]
MNDERCPECGAFVSGGLVGCRAVWDEIAVLAYSHPTYAATRDLAFDAYCMQHPEQYGRSAKSYAAHLTRLCCGLEHSADPAIYAAIRQWLDGVKVEIEKPPLLSERGHLTVLDVRAARTPAEHTRLVHEWAGTVWEAYREQHALARNWIRAALAAPRKVRTKQRRP